ncbi:NDP-hexose 2,3-dehydratase family protein [Nocardiopsis sp. NPDC006139]|uniref:NDP-hexose 2,3-dehydratase family protein n=1 Tax=Nocardiopsis sp. NPDC006139 TaxID=3154578 RepID=UPI0033A3D22F
MTPPGTAPAAPRPVAPRWRSDRSAAARLRRSAAVVSTPGHPDGVAGVLDWIAERARSGGFGVDRIPFDAMGEWGFDPATGDLVHRTGRFFAVRGLRVCSGSGPADVRHQPVIDQPEVGVLGILAQEIDGVLHLLMQAKMEPGNPDPVQLSPTVQATRSNLSRAHGGRTVRYLEYFLDPGEGRVLADVLQSEHGDWFLRKSNRNMIVEVPAGHPVPEHPDFRWMSLGALGRLLRLDGVVNMDARSVLACAPAHAGAPDALHTDTDLRSWFVGERSLTPLRADPVPLAGLPGWQRGADRIHREDGLGFEVVAVGVRAGSREVARWSQPLLRPVGERVAAFLTRRFGGVPHLLVRARPEGGLPGGVELGPTVQGAPGDPDPFEGRSPFLDAVLSARGDAVLYRAVHTEEGGRFLDSHGVYTVVRDDTAPADPPPGHRWATPAQLGELLRHGHYVNVQARTLLSCVVTGAVRL